MKMQRILCPIDFSFPSKVANYYASLFAEATDAQVIYLNVNWPPSNELTVEQQLEQQRMTLSTQVRPFVHDVKHRFEVRDGNPGKEILKAADEFNVNLIVMGTQGRSGAARLLHGSVCNYVLRNASCPVMAVKSAINMNWLVSDEEREALEKGSRVV